MFSIGQLSSHYSKYNTGAATLPRLVKRRHYRFDPQRIYVNVYRGRSEIAVISKLRIWTNSSLFYSTQHDWPRKLSEIIWQRNCCLNPRGIWMKSCIAEERKIRNCRNRLILDTDKFLDILLHITQCWATDSVSLRFRSLWSPRYRSIMWCHVSLSCIRSSKPTYAWP